MKEFHQINNRTSLIKGTGIDLSVLKQLINTKKVISFEIEYELEPLTKNQSIELFSNDGSKILSFHEYKSYMKNKNEYDFIYDSIIERFYIKDKPSIPSGSFIQGTEVIKYLAKARYPIGSRELASELFLRSNDSGALIRQAIKRIRDKTLVDLILYVDKRGYILNPQVDWLIIQRVING